MDPYVLIMNKLQAEECEGNFEIRKNYSLLLITSHSGIYIKLRVKFFLWTLSILYIVKLQPFGKLILLWPSGKKGD
jgi:hypothetical protein